MIFVNCDKYTYDLIILYKPFSVHVLWFFHVRHGMNSLLQNPVQREYLILARKIENCARAYSFVLVILTFCLIGIKIVHIKSPKSTPSRPFTVCFSKYMWISVADLRGSDRWVTSYSEFPVFLINIVRSGTGRFICIITYLYDNDSSSEFLSFYVSYYYGLQITAVSLIWSLIKYVYFT